MKSIITVIVICLLVCSSSFAATLHVPSQYPTIQAGINAAADGDTVLVAAGGYSEHIDFLGKEIVVISASGPELTAIVWAGQEDLVTFNSSENAGAEISGFTLQNDYVGNYAGIGVYCGAGTAPIIRNNIIQYCGSVWSYPGGGIGALGSNPVIEYNQIIGNECAYNGAGIFLQGCPYATVSNNIISGNYTWSGYGVALGGGICCENSLAVIRWNLIINNLADPDHGYGGGLALGYADSGEYFISHNTFVGNVAYHGNFPAGGGAYFSGNGDVNFSDNIMVNSLQGGGVVFGWGSANLTFDFNDVWNNAPFNYSAIVPGTGDISSDPLFEGGSPYSYELTAPSPCIDAGSFTANPDPDGTRADMGAYYFDQPGMNIMIQANDWPINIPAAGGVFGYSLYLLNHTSATITFDVWVDVVLPDSSIFGPIILRPNLTFEPVEDASRSLAQTVPANAPAGNYLYRAHTGIYQTGQIFCETAMPFTKLGVAESDEKWTIKGELEDWGNVQQLPAKPVD